LVNHCFTTGGNLHQYELIHAAQEPNAMTERYQPLSLHRIDKGVVFCRPWQRFPERLTLDTPAIECMTDLRQMTAITIPPNAPIDRALDKMIQTGVRLLLVVNEGRNVLGVITARDIQGEKPMRFQQDMGVNRAEVLVRDVMTPQSRIDVIEASDLDEATVGDIIVTLRKDLRQHALVLDHSREDGRESIRGIFSATQICRMLGVQVRFDDISKTFDELKGLID
jgi:CBS domain containing-hemolysin-like protein